MKKYKSLFEQNYILNFNKTYHGTKKEKVSGILSSGFDVSKSRGKSVGIYNSISVTDNPLLAKSMTKGELGFDKEGEIFEIKKPLKILDIRTSEGRKLWNEFDNSPKNVLENGYDGVAFKNVESIRIESFYKDIPVNKIKNALEIQVFSSIEPKWIKIFKGK